MSQNVNAYGSAPQGSPQNPPNHGYSDLMSTLVSPGIPKPVQESFTSQWPGVQGWDNTAQHEYGYNTPFHGPMASIYSHESNNPRSTIPELMQENHYGSVHSIPNQASRKDTDAVPSLSVPVQALQDSPDRKIQDAAPPGLPATIKSPNANEKAKHADRAAQLRAQLLLAKKKGTPSAHGSPAGKSKNLPPQSNDIAPNVAVGNQNERKADATSSEKPDHLTPVVGMNSDLECLFAEARSAIDFRTPEGFLTNGSRKADDTKQKIETNSSAFDIMEGDRKPESDPKAEKSHSLSELSEGEIRCDSESAKPGSSNEPSEPAKLKEAREISREHEEKQRRQSQVYLAYQPLKDPAQQMETEPARNMTPSSNQGPLISPIPHYDTRGRRLSINGTDRAPEYDSHKSLRDAKADYERDRERVSDMYRRDDDRERRDYESSMLSTETKHPAATFKQNLEARSKRLSDDNAKAAAEYKRKLEAKEAREAVEDATRAREFEEYAAQQAAASSQIEASRTSSYGSRDRKDQTFPHKQAASVMPTTELDSNDQMPPTPSTFHKLVESPTLRSISSEDLHDWLELTEFHDEEYRMTRLARFRKKKRLDAERAELEREEQLELEQRSSFLRAQSTLPTESPKVRLRAPIINAANITMAPPPVPFKQLNNDAGVKVKESATSAGFAQPLTSHAKRQHAVDDGEYWRMQPQEKIARTNANGHANKTDPTSPNNVKEEPQAMSRGGLSSFDNRFTRDDDQSDSRYRPRSISPRTRRRSMSPRRRISLDSFTDGHRNPNELLPEQSYHRTCRNCHQEGHYQKDCPYLRRDGQGRYQGGLPNHGNTSDYRGRLPSRGGSYRPPPNRGTGNVGRSGPGSLPPEG